MASQQVGDFAMSPEERSDHGSAARAVRSRIQGRAFRNQHVRNLRLVRVCSCMERCPATVVRIIYVGTCRQQRLDRSHATFPFRGEADGEIQQRVAVSPALIGGKLAAIASSNTSPCGKWQALDESIDQAAAC